MRIATWNCAGRFRDKVARALSLEADILVIQEAESPASYADRLLGEYDWTDAGHGKGMLVAVQRGWSVTRPLGLVADPPFNHVVPLTLTPPEGQEVCLWAVWCMDAPRRADAWVAQLHHALDAMPDLLTTPAVIAGDLNSNARWDNDRALNHTRLVSRLCDRGIVSAYHVLTGEVQGAESAPTFWLAKNPARGFHIDYVFTDLEVQGVEVGTYTDWCRPLKDGGVSDHAPLIATLV